MAFALVAAVLLTLVAVGMARAAQVDPASYGALHWRSIGPFRGGRVLAVAGAPDDRLRFYFGAVNGGVWETRDAGRTWAPIFDSVPVGSIGALAVAPSDSEGALRRHGRGRHALGHRPGRSGMFKSVDGGKTWRAIGLADSQSIAKILVDPRNPDVVLVAALGHPYGPNAERGVFRSADGGRTWTRTLFSNADTGAIDLAFKPGRSEDGLCGAMADAPAAMERLSALQRTGRRSLQVRRRRRSPGREIAGHGLPDAPGRIGLADGARAPPTASMP